MVGGAASHFVEEVNAVHESFLQRINVLDVDSACRAELFVVRFETGFVYVEALVGTERGENLSVKRVVFRKHLVPFKGVYGIVRRADDLDAGLSYEIAHAH